MVTVKDIVTYMENIAPPSLAESWDHVGLQWGRSTQKVDTVALALTPSFAMIHQAIDLEAQLLITHHPLIFGELDRVNDENPFGELLLKMAEKQLSHFCAHTNLDIADLGVNDVLANRIGLCEVHDLQPAGSEEVYKMVVFVPTSHHEELRNHLFEIGCGASDLYHECSWQVLGTGTFLPFGEDVNPYEGEKGKKSVVEEMRLEVLVPAALLSKAQEVINKYHPYEEPAYDVFLEEHMQTTHGLGRIGYLPEKKSGTLFIDQLKKQLDIPTIRYAGNDQKMIQKIALCGGSGASLIDTTLQLGCDVLITGDIKFHDAQKAVEHDLLLVDAGHFYTERPIIESLAERLQTRFPTVKFISISEKDFFNYR